MRGRAVRIVSAQAGLPVAHAAEAAVVGASLVRLPLAVGLGGVEAITTSGLFVFEADIPLWQHPTFWLRHFILLGIVAFVAWGVAVWPRRREVVAIWNAEATSARWGMALALNLGLFCVLTVSTILFSSYAAPLNSMPWGWFGLYCIALFATGVSLVLLAAPARFWVRLIFLQWLALSIAVVLAAVVLMLGFAARNSWSALAGLTLGLSGGLLSLFERGVTVDFESQMLGLGDFAVIIDQACAGYEGMALVTGFLALYLWVFRNVLRFPHAILLLPLGLAAIFLLNIVRIAVLVSIGAHFSPAVAIGGFHSQAGWMAFLGVTVGMMFVVPRVAFFARTAAAPRRLADDSERAMQAFVVPFMALMAGSIASAALAPYDTGAYGLKIAVAGAALWVFRDVYRPLVARASGAAVAAGLLVGAVWIGTDPGGAATPGQGLGAWIAGLPPALLAGWLVVRAVGGIVVVPIVEELAFRGLLYRWLVSRDFERVAFTRLSWVALAASSALFGLLHSRPLAGALAGAVFGLLMVRSGRLSDAVAAHVAANALIFAWAVAFAQWSLL